MNESEDINTALRRLAEVLPDSLVANEGDIQRERFVRRYLREGYLFDAALARALEATAEVTGFLTALQAAWGRTSRCASHELAEDRCEVSILDAILLYQETTEPDCNGGYREDKLAAYIRQHVKEVNGAYTTGRLGKLLSNHGVGHVRTCRADDNGRLGGQGYKVSVLYLEEADLEQMRMAAARMGNPE